MSGSGVDIGSESQKCEVERVIIKRKIVSRHLEEDGSVKVVSVGIPTVTTSPERFVKLSSEFAGLMAYESSSSMAVLFVVCSELASYKFSDQVYLHHHEGISKSSFNKGVNRLIEIGLLRKTENPHIYSVNRSFIEYGKNKRPDVSRDS
jgi:hypothetical protein